MVDSEAATGPAMDGDYVGWLDRLWSQRLRATPDRKPELSIGILLWPTFPMMSLAGILEPLRHAADFADNSRPLHCRWSVMGDPGQVTSASNGIRVQADSPYVNPSDFDYIAVIGGLLANLRAAPPQHTHYIRVAAAAGVPLIGVCTGVFVLAQEGLLKGHKVCVHPFHRGDFRYAFPTLRITTSQDFIVDRGRITVPGGISILSLMTYLVRTHCGADRAAKVVHQLSLTQRSSVDEFSRAQAHGFTHAADPRLQRAIVAVESRMGKNVTADGIAAEAGVSQRQLSRLFQERFGMTLKQFVIETRLRYALWLLENTRHSVTTIAQEAGFADCSHLTTSFKARYGRTPSDVRSPPASVIQSPAPQAPAPQAPAPQAVAPQPPAPQAARGLSRRKPSLATINSRV
jgi:transcriptional regulator GlxA family with amidase domain